MAKLFNPLADRLIQEINAKGPDVKFVKPGKKLPLGKLAVFKYDPKHKGTLAYYDTFPASIVLAHYSDGFLGINVHYVNWALRLNLAERLLRATKNKNRITYGRIKKALKGLQLPIAYSAFILKRYLYSHITSKQIAIFELDNFRDFLKDVHPKFQKKSDMAVYKLTMAQFSNYAKTKQPSKKPKFTNIKRKK